MKAWILVMFYVGCQFHAPKELMKTNMAPHIEKGQKLAVSYGCASCHEMQGAIDNPGMIGPPLTHWNKRKYFAGKFINNEENLLKWIISPEKLKSGTGMPNLEVTMEDAIDIAAFLNSQ